MFSLAGLLLSGLLVGIIARSLVSGPPPGTLVTVFAGVSGTIGATLVVRTLGWNRFAFPAGVVLSIAGAAAVLSLHRNWRSEHRAASRLPESDRREPSSGALGRPAPSQSIGTILALACAWAVAGALMLGVAGFAIGFFGPIRFQPWSNQGPLLGLFITGPLGALLGGVIGFVLKVARPEWSTSRMLWTLNGATLAYSLLVLYIVTNRSWWP